MRQLVKTSAGQPQHVLAQLIHRLPASKPALDETVAVLNGTSSDIQRSVLVELPNDLLLTFADKDFALAEAIERILPKDMKISSYKAFANRIAQGEKKAGAPSAPPPYCASPAYANNNAGETGSGSSTSDATAHPLLERGPVSEAKDVDTEDLSAKVGRQTALIHRLLTEKMDAKNADPKPGPAEKPRRHSF